MTLATGESSSFSFTTKEQGRKMSEDEEATSHQEEVVVVVMASRWTPQRSSSNNSMRWMVLAACCLVMTGVYYSLDTPAALHAQLQEMFEQEDSNFEFHFNLLYSVYSLPNVVLPFAGGYFVDRTGAAVCLTLFAAACGVGQTIFAFGLFYKQWKMMWLGRAVYGLGGESICVAYSTLLSEWFSVDAAGDANNSNSNNNKSTELAMAFGIALAVSRLGSVLNNLVSPVVANVLSPSAALFVGALFNGVSFVTALYLRYIDQSRNKMTTVVTSQNEGSVELEEPLLASHREEEGGLQQEQLEDQQGRDHEESSFFATPEVSSRKHFGPLFWLLSLSCLTVYACILPWNNVASGILLERNFFLPPPNDCHLQFPNNCTYGTLQITTNPAQDANGDTCPILPHHAPLLPESLNTTLPDGSIISKEAINGQTVDCNDKFWAKDCTADYCSSFQQATETAARYMSIPYTISACLSPLLGRLVDTVGRRAWITMAASVLLVLVHASLALTSIPPGLALVGQGLAYAFYASVLWPSVTLVVPKHLTGQAFGIITSIQNIGLAVFPMIVAAVYRGSHQLYIPRVELFFASCAGVGSLIGVVLNVLDRKMGNRLNSISGKGDSDGGDDDGDVVVALEDTGAVQRELTET